MHLFHPDCLKSPEMTPEQYAQLLQSMQDNGFDSQYPIIRFDGMILDGRHRYKAAKEMGIEPVFVDWKPVGNDTPAKFALRSNIRRDMTVSQKAAYMVRMNGGELSISEMADMANVSPRTIAKAKAIQREAPEMIEQIASGEITLADAERTLEEPKAVAEEEPTKDQAEAALASKARFNEVVKQVSLLEAAIENLARDPIGCKVRMNQISVECKNIRDAIRWATPFKRCPYKTCSTTGCKACGGNQWVTKDVWNNIPKEIKGNEAQAVPE